MGTSLPGTDRRRVVWAWHVAGTAGRCRLLWKLDDIGARIWAESHELDLERIEGTKELKNVAPPGPRMRGPARAAPAQVRRFPRR